jgi:hypothetical protein
VFIYTFHHAGIMPTIDTYGFSKFFNWQQVPNALMMLIVAMTGDAWDDFMGDTMVAAPYCHDPHCMLADGSPAPGSLTQEQCLEQGLMWYPYRCGTREQSLPLLGDRVVAPLNLL